MNDEKLTEAKTESYLFGASSRFWLALTVVGTACAMALCGMKVEEPLYSAMLVSLTYYFGQKTKSP